MILHAAFGIRQLGCDVRPVPSSRTPGLVSISINLTIKHITNYEKIITTLPFPGQVMGVAAAQWLTHSVFAPTPQQRLRFLLVPEQDG